MFEETKVYNRSSKQFASCRILRCRLGRLSKDTQVYKWIRFPYCRGSCQLAFKETKRESQLLLGKLNMSQYVWQQKSQSGCPVCCAIFRTRKVLRESLFLSTIRVRSILGRTLPSINATSILPFRTTSYETAYFKTRSYWNTVRLQTK